MNSFNSLWKLAASFVVLTSFADAGPFSIPETQLASVRPQFPTGGGPFVIPKTPDDYPPPPILSTPEVSYRYETRYRKEAYQQRVKICEPGKPCRYEMRTYYRSVPYQEKIPVASSQRVLSMDAIAKVRAGTASAPTPMKEVARILNLLQPQPNETFVDFGCGDARFLITAVRYFKCRGIGIEIDPEKARLAAKLVDEAGMSDRIHIINGDATKMDVEADIGFAFLFPDTLLEVKPKLMKLKRFVTYRHGVAGVPMWNYGNGVFYFNQSQPAVVQQQRQVQPQRRLAVWRGQHYAGVLCNNPRCEMCASIASQLGWR